MFIGMMFLLLQGEPVGFKTNNTFGSLGECIAAVEQDVLVVQSKGVLVIEAGCAPVGEPV